MTKIDIHTAFHYAYLMDHLSTNPDIARHDRLHKNGPAKIASVVATLLFLTGCATHEAGAEKVPTSPDHETVSTTEAPAVLSLDEARSALETFKPAVNPTLHEFSQDSNRERARSDAEAYKALKDSKLAIVNFTDLPQAQVEQFGDAVGQRIEFVTQDTFQVDVAVIQASDVAKQLYQEQRHRTGFNQENTQDYASAIADVAMPEIDSRYQSVIALTNDGFHGKSFTMSSGKYSDIANVPKEYTAILDNGGKSESDTGLLRDPRNSTVHEWLHGVAQLEHSEAALNATGDLSGSFPASQHAPQQVVLNDFFQSASVDEYGGGGIMGATQDIGDDLQPLSVAELYETEAAERFLDEPCITKEDLLNEVGEATYRPATENGIAVIQLSTPSTEYASPSFNVIERITLSPRFEHGISDSDPDYWNVRVVALTADNAAINLTSLDFQDGTKPKTIMLPDGRNVTIEKTTTDNLHVSLS